MLLIRPPPLANIQPDTVTPMVELVYNVLEDEAPQFLNKHLAQLGGLYVYSFTIELAGVAWKIFKRYVDFMEFSRSVSLATGQPMQVLAAESAATLQLILSEMAGLLRLWATDLSVLTLFNSFIEHSDYDYHGLVKYKEVLLNKRNGGRQKESCRCCLKPLARCRSWKPMLFIVHSEGVLYKDKYSLVQDYLQYDWDFIMLTGPQETDRELGLTLYSVHRKLYLEAFSQFDYVLVVFAVREALRRSSYNALHRFDAFFPNRKSCSAEFYVDGDRYFRDVAHTMLAAREQILITDWMLSPEFYLVRPVTALTEQFRLDRVLGLVAARGVRVHVILYEEATMLNNASKYAKTALEKLHPNIRVLRHPHTMVPFMWSHHEKMVVVDEVVAFAGGLDLTYSRYDTSQHPLFDYSGDVFPGIEYTNERKQEVKDVEQFAKEHLSRDAPRMPWHDVAVRLRGEVVNDLATHFIRYWNYANANIKIQNRLVMANKQTIRGKACQRLYQGMYYVKDLFNRCWKKLSPPDQDRFTDDRYIQELEEEPRPASDQPESSHRLFRGKPKHQAQYEKKVRARIKAAEDFEKGLDPRFIKLILKVVEKNHTKRDKFNEDFIWFGEKSSFAQMMQPNPNQMAIRQNSEDFWSKADRSGNMSCQLLRSCSAWSIGREPLTTEFSIQIAYIQLIGMSKHFIFIENQFFISSTADEKVVKNQICNAIVERIVLAFERREPFKVYVFMPLLPSFAGEVTDENAGIMRLTLHWELLTISQCESSIIGQLLARIGTWQEYIQFLGLRNHGRRTPTSAPATELIYIHSKLMIVDDELVILGSANINDRSMNGGRDSEIAFVVKDKDEIPAVLANRPVMVRRAAHHLRCRLFNEHFGLTQQVDPVSEDTWNLTRAIAAENTLIYRTVFGCYPDDYIINYKDITTIKALSNIGRYEELRHKIRGHAVQFPIYFLSGEDLKSTKCLESMMPNSTTT